MRKSLVTLLAAAACATPFAQAEGTPITVDFTYDSALLATEAGAKAIVKSLKDQATEACAFQQPITGVRMLDRTCRDDLVADAIEKISLAASEEGQTVTYVFASIETEADTLN